MVAVIIDNFNKEDNTMSVDSNFYVGPAIIIGDKQVPVTKNVKSCNNKDCSNYLCNWVSRDTYCSKCGSAIIDIEYDTTERLDVDSLLYDNKLDRTIREDIFSELEGKPIVNVMNLKSLCVPIKIGYGEFAVLTDELKESYMRNAKEHEDVKQFLALLDKMNILYTFEFITTAYYS